MKNYKVAHIFTKHMRGRVGASCSTRLDAAFSFQSFAHISKRLLDLPCNLLACTFGLLATVAGVASDAFLDSAGSILDAAFHLVAVHDILHK